MKEKYLKVREYAELNGISQQAVYKKLRNGQLQSAEIETDGKKVKYIIVSEKTEPQEPGQGSGQESGENDGAISVNLVKTLTAQLKEKDDQIKWLQQQNAELLQIVKSSQKQRNMITAGTLALEPGEPTPAAAPDQENAAQRKGIFERIKSLFETRTPEP